MAATKNQSKGKSTKKNAVSMTVIRQAEKSAEKFAQGIVDVFTAQSEDIIDLIKEHHKPLKELIKKMKSEDATYAEKKKAFKEFAPTLVAHAKPEEKAWYKDMKEEHDMNVDAIEGDVEHGIADKLCAELKRTTDRDTFMAKVKVLAEVVEHHIKEEEEDLLPKYKDESDSAERIAVGKRYLKLRERYLN